MAEEDRATMPKDGNMNAMQMLQPKPGGTQLVDYTGSSVQTAAAVGSNGVWVETTTDAYIRFGSNPTAVADDTDFLMKANKGHYFKADANVDIVAAIQKDTAGEMRVSDMQ